MQHILLTSPFPFTKTRTFLPVQNTPTSAAKPFLKVRYVFDDDRDSTSNTELVEGTHFWWVPVLVFSKAYYEHVDREAAEKAAAWCSSPPSRPRRRCRE